MRNNYFRKQTNKLDAKCIGKVKEIYNQMQIENLVKEKHEKQTRNESIFSKFFSIFITILLQFTYKTL